MSERHLYVGLISGTSMDGIDAVVASFGDRDVELAATLIQPYPDELQRKLQRAIRAPEITAIDTVGELDTWIGECFRDAALAVVESAGLKSDDIRAIGSHGQTLRHCPDAAHPFTLQIGNPAEIAVGTGITTVADFRRTDLALSGQGAPLTPPFHEWLFRKPGESRIVVNIGGIANLTVLPGDDSDVSGFDSGPGNTLLNAWINEHQGVNYDTDGAWAASGTVDPTFLQALSSDTWFRQAPPKSTGFEYFNLDWLRGFGADNLKAQDVQATLVELSATSIVDSLRQWAPTADEVFVCGGGVHNTYLMKRLAFHLGKTPVQSTGAVGLDPDWVEACAFAWLATRTLNRDAGNLPAVTGASRKAVLGAIYRS